MAMKIKVVCMIGSGMPIVATAGRLLCVVTEAGACYSGDAAAGAAAGVGRAQRCRSNAKRAISTVTARDARADAKTRSG